MAEGDSGNRGKRANAVDPAALPGGARGIPRPSSPPGAARRSRPPDGIDRPLRPPVKPVSAPALPNAVNVKPNELLEPQLQPPVIPMASPSGSAACPPEVPPPSRDPGPSRDTARAQSSETTGGTLLEYRADPSASADLRGGDPSVERNQEDDRPWDDEYGAFARAAHAEDDAGAGSTSIDPLAPKTGSGYSPVERQSEPGASREVSDGTRLASQGGFPAPPILEVAPGTLTRSDAVAVKSRSARRSSSGRSGPDTAFAVSEELPLGRASGSEGLQCNADPLPPLSVSERTNGIAESSSPFPREIARAHLDVQSGRARSEGHLRRLPAGETTASIVSLGIHSLYAGWVGIAIGLKYTVLPLLANVLLSGFFLLRILWQDRDEDDRSDDQPEPAALRQWLSVGMLTTALIHAAPD